MDEWADYPSRQRKGGDRMTLPTLPENYRRVLNLIRVGADNPITGAEIALILKLEERTVQSIVSRLITR